MNLGDRAKDQITGFEGIVTGLVQYVTGCNQVLLAPPSRGGDFKESQWFDVDRCVITAASAVKLADVSNSSRPGSDAPAPRR